MQNLPILSSAGMSSPSRKI